MDKQQSRHRLILKMGVALSLGLIVLAVYGLLDATLDGSFFRNMIPVSVALGAFNLAGCISGLRK